MVAFFAKNLVDLIVNVLYLPIIWCVGGTEEGRAGLNPHVARLGGRVSKQALSTSCMFTNKSLSESRSCLKSKLQKPFP